MSPIESDQEEEIAETEESNGTKFGLIDAETTEEIKKVEENIVEEVKLLKLEHESLAINLK